MKFAVSIFTSISILAAFDAAGLRDGMTTFSEWSAQQGALGVLAFILFYGIVTTACAPASALNLAAGAVFGPVVGSLASIAGLALSATFGFLISRYIARAPLERRLRKSPRFHMIDTAIGQQGWKIVGLLRLCPLPFGPSNLAYGLTSISFWHYLGATIVGVIPATVMITYMGAVGRSGLEAMADGKEAGRSPLQWILLGMMLFAGIVALGMIGRIVKKAIETRIDEPSSDAAE